MGEALNFVLSVWVLKPKWRFKTEVAAYSYTVLHRYLLRALEEFELSVKDSSEKDDTEIKRRIEVFAQAWLFRVGRTVNEFIGKNTDKVIIDEYIEEKYGAATELSGKPTETQNADYGDILSGMRAANEVELYRSVGGFIAPQLLQHKRAS